MPAFAKDTRNSPASHRFAALKYSFLARCGLGGAVAAAPAAVPCADLERLHALLRDIDEALSGATYAAEAVVRAACDLQDALPEGCLFVVGVERVMGELDRLWTLHEQLVELLPPERPIG